MKVKQVEEEFGKGLFEPKRRRRRRPRKGKQEPKSDLMVASVKTTRGIDLSTRKQTKYSVALDDTRRYLTNSITPSLLGSIFINIDQGDIAAMVELDEEILGKDSHAQSVARTRRGGVTALEWEIVPDARHEDSEDAKEAAEYATEQLMSVGTWEESLKHFATAIGPGIAVTENIWKEGRLVETIDVPGNRLEGGIFNPQELRILTDEQQVNGIPVMQPKFSSFCPHGWPLYVTITRAQAILYLRKHFTEADADAYQETFGQPTRVGTYESGSDNDNLDVRDKLEQILRDMGTDTYAVLPDTVKLEYISASTSASPYAERTQALDKATSILWLGQTLTTEQGDVGSLALGRVHEGVKASILQADLKSESAFIREAYLKWIVNFRWPTRDMPIPVWRRRILEERNLDAERLELEQLTKAQELGLTIDEAVLRERLRVPEPISDSIITLGSTESNEDDEGTF